MARAERLCRAALALVAIGVGALTPAVGGAAVREARVVVAEFASGRADATLAARAAQTLREVLAREAKTATGVSLVSPKEVVRAAATVRLDARSCVERVCGLALARAVTADALVLGSVSRRKAEVRIELEEVDAGDGATLWRGVFTTRDDAGSLRDALVPAARAILERLAAARSGKPRLDRPPEAKGDSDLERGSKPLAKKELPASPPTSRKEAESRVELPAAPPALPSARPAPTDSAPAPRPAAGALRPTVGRPGAPPASPGMKAGWSDDNEQFNAYLRFLEDQGSRAGALPLDVSGRVVLRVTDGNGRPVPNAEVTIHGGRRVELARRTTYADGRALFFPAEQLVALPGGWLRAVARWRGQTVEQSFTPGRETAVELRFQELRPGSQQVPLDVAFLLDTTGSMGDELARLKASIEIINFQIENLPVRPRVRFGAVLYRDRGDAYVTRTIPFQRDAEMFRRELARVEAGGGGDTPEDVQSGLRAAVQGLAWGREGVRLVFLIGDAPPHLDYGQTYTYLDAAREAAGRGIKICSVGASGLDLRGEVVWRQLAQYTLGRFIFLTYGETGESEGGTPTAVSHHTGENFVTRNLETIVVGIVRRELANLEDQTAEPEQDYFDAVAVNHASDDAVLDDLFRQGMQQLVDFAVVRLEAGSPTVVLPVAVPDESLAARAERLEDKLTQAAFVRPEFRLLERANLQQVMDELRLQASALFDSEGSVELGRVVGARLLLASKVHRGGDRVEMVLKLIRVETGEVLSMALLKMEPALL